VEKSVAKCYQISSARLEVDPDEPHLHRRNHIKYLKRGLFQKLPSSTESLDSSRGWIVYWITHSLHLLEPDGELSDEQKDIITASLSKYQSPSGGFAGGPQQISHLAATYAVVNALFTLNGSAAVHSIDKGSLYKFLMTMKQSDGSFLMHVDGEADVRGIYCALSVAYLTGILDDNLKNNCSKWITSCQTYEGGFGGCPGAEAHGGYTFCAVAALAILNSLDECDMKSLLRFITNRQQSFEGGFAGRTNKLVDGCYSFWVGGIFPILHSFLSAKGKTNIQSHFSDVTH
jgi:protein farnesyltransferase subunit beta